MFKVNQTFGPVSGDTSSCNRSCKLTEYLRLRSPKVPSLLESTPLLSNTGPISVSLSDYAKMLSTYKYIHTNNYKFESLH